MKLNTFEIKEFGGLATGAPRGSATLGFRVLDGFTHKGLVGGLTIATGKRQIFTNTESVSRLFTLWDEEIYPPKIVFQGPTNVVKTAYFADISGLTTITTGTNPGKIMKGWRGKIVFVNFDGVIGYRTNASSYGVKFIAYAGEVSNVISAVAPTITAVGVDGSLVAGIWAVYLLPLKGLALGSDTVYVPARNPTVGGGGNATITAAKEHIEVLWSGTDPVEIVLTSGTAPNYTFYYAGFFKTQPATIRTPPLEGSNYQSYPMQFSSRVKAEALTYRNDRTWAAVNAYRDYDTEIYTVGGNGKETVTPSTTSTIYFSSTGKPWTFPAENFITLSITGNITALANLSSALLVFSKSEIWAITGNSDADFVAFKIPGANPGCIDPQGVQEWRDVLFYVAPDGVYKVNLNGSQNVSLPIRDVFLNMGSNPVLSTGIDRFNNEFLLALNGILYVLDLEKNVWLTRGTANVVEGGDVPVIALDATVSAFDAKTNIQTAVFQTEFLDMDMPEMDKFFRQLRLVVENPTGFDCAIAVQPIKFDGTLLTAPASQTVNANSRARLNFGLKGQGMVGRGLAFKVTVVGYPGVVIRPDITIEWRALGTRGR